ncbi:MAG: ABC transporter ATP-binding protein [Gammaproteobacteria bacterium]
MSHLLEVENLQVRFGSGNKAVPAVDDISFSVDEGRTLALLGESGSGKSVSALSVMRLLPPAARIDGGRVLLRGTDLFGLPEFAMRKVRGGRIAMIFQEPQTSLNPVLTVGRQIGETLKQHKGLAGRAQRERVIELLGSVGIPEPERRLDEYPHQYSGGMKQRVMIAIALAAEPELLIADEPSTALDVTIQAQVLRLLRELQERTGMGILFITHDLGVAWEMGHDIAVMYQGRIVENKSRDDFFRQPEHPYSQRLFDALPSKAKRDREEAGRRRQSVAGQGKLLSVTDMKVHFPIKKGLFKRTVGYVRAVDGVSLDIRPGQTVAVVGESGSGKTTMGKGILRLLHTTDGSVMFEDRDLLAMPAGELRRRRSDIQIVFQDPYASMNPRMMVADIIMEGMAAQGIGRDRRERMQRVDKLLQQVDLLPEHKFRYPHEFSGGQRQRICIARALAVDPKLIICDEPTSALDLSVQAQILRLLDDLQRDLGVAYLFITHNISVVEYLAHYVAVMYEGKIVEQGTVDEVLYNSKHEYTRKLLAAVPKVGCEA